MENYEKRSVGLDEADRALLGSDLTDLEKYLIESQQLIKIRGKVYKASGSTQVSVAHVYYSTNSRVQKMIFAKSNNMATNSDT